jgi:hypothetical protein
MCSDISEFSILGSGFPLYLQTFSMLAFFLFQSLIIFGLYDLISNYISSNATFSFLLRLSLPSKENEHSLLIVQGWLVFVSILIFHISFQLYLRYQKLTEREANRGLISPASFTVMIDYIFDPELTSEKVSFFLQSSFASFSFSFNIRKIVLSYKISDYVAHIQYEKELLKKHRITLRKKGIPLYSSSSPLLPNPIPTPFQQADFHPSPSGTVFVTFNTMKETQEFLSKYRFTYSDKLKWIICPSLSNSSKLVYNNSHLYVEQAKQPNDILWENLGLR